MIDLKISPPLWSHTLLLAASAILVFASTATRRRRKRRDRWPIAPNEIPFLGHALALSDSDEFNSTLKRWAGEVGRDGIYEFSLFGQRWIVLCSADTVMKAMSLRPFKLRRATKLDNSMVSLENRGIFNAEGDKWKKVRRIVAPALNKNHMEDYYPSIKLVAQRLIKKWNGQSIVIASPDISSCATDVIALTILGLDFDSLNNPNYVVVKDIKAVFHSAFLRSLTPIPYWKIPFIGQNLDAGKYHNDRILTMMRSLVQDYRKKVEANNNADQHQQQQQQEQQNGKKKAFLQKIIDISDGGKTKLDEDSLVSNLVTMLFAGTDTSASTIEFCLWELAHNSILQDEIYKEITEFGKDLDDLTMDDVIDCFPRLRSLFFEVLRVKGAVSFLFLEPVQSLEFEGKTIAPGTIIVTLLRSLPKEIESEVPVGPNGEGQEDFCPRRWLVPLKDGTSNPNGAVKVVEPSNKVGGFMAAFGHGPRICPGKLLAEGEILTMLIYILRSFEVSVPNDHPPIKVVTRMTETFNGNMTLSLKPRE